MALVLKRIKLLYLNRENGPWIRNDEQYLFAYLKTYFMWLINNAYSHKLNYLVNFITFHDSGEIELII